MKVIVLDGSTVDDPVAPRIRERLTAEMRARGWKVETVLLRGKKIGNCAGDFYCWIRTPGVCNVADDNRDIARAVIASDLMIYLTPVTFGGYSSVLKRMVDHLLQNGSPFFAEVAGETHHQERYDQYADFLTIGWLDAPDWRDEAIFHHLTARNAINLNARTSVSGVVIAGWSDMELYQRLRGWLDDVVFGSSSRPVPLPVGLPVSGGADPRKIYNALLLVGSPRTQQSTSHALGDYVLEQLDAKGIVTETRCIHTSLSSAEGTLALLEAVDAADLVILAFPLYFDTLPAPVMDALERIARHRASIVSSDTPMFCAIGNCGFPEAAHLANALAVCEAFARRARFEWAGALALGGGEGLVHCAPLRELGARAQPITRALEIAAEALAVGLPIPPAAASMMAKVAVPSWIYRFLGGWGWRQRAKANGLRGKDLRRRPYDVATR